VRRQRPISRGVNAAPTPRVPLETLNIVLNVVLEKPEVAAKVPEHSADDFRPHH